MQKKTRSKSKNKEHDRSIEDEVQKILAVPVNLDKGGQVKIASSNLEGIKLTKKMRKHGKESTILKRRKLDEKEG
jgi:plasmid stability protein